MHYVALYKHILKHGSIQEDILLEKNPSIKKTQLSNLRANLYRQVLRSLRDMHKEDYLEIKAREQFDFAKILYSKGQYRASLDMLQKTKALARRINKQPLEYLALHFEKHIESQHVTGSMALKAKQLEADSTAIIDGLLLTNELSNLALLMYGKYLELGLVRNKAEQASLAEYFRQILPDTRGIELDFYQRLYLYQSYLWYYTMVQDFAKYYLYAQRWAELYETHPTMQKIETVTYIKAIHNVLNALYLAGKTTKFLEAYDKLMRFNNDDSFKLSNNEQSQLTLFQHTHFLNRTFIVADYKEQLSALRPIEDLLHTDQYDLNRRMTMHYKLACVYFGADELERCLDHLNLVTNKQYVNFKSDIQCYARILKLITHFDRGDYDLVAYDVKAVYRFLLKMSELEAPQKEIIKFIRKTPQIPRDRILSAFEALRKRLVPMEKDPIDRRTFIYLDIISWLDSKLKGISMRQAILERRGE